MDLRVLHVPLHQLQELQDPPRLPAEHAREEGHADGLEHVEDVVLQQQAEVLVVRALDPGAQGDGLAPLGDVDEADLAQHLRVPRRDAPVPAREPSRLHELVAPVLQRAALGRRREELERQDRVAYLDEAAGRQRAIRFCEHGARVLETGYQLAHFIMVECQYLFYLLVGPKP